MRPVKGKEIGMNVNLAFSVQHQSEDAQQLYNREKVELLEGLNSNGSSRYASGVK